MSEQQVSGSVTSQAGLAGLEDTPSLEPLQWLLPQAGMFSPRLCGSLSPPLCLLHLLCEAFLSPLFKTVTPGPSLTFLI